MKYAAADKIINFGLDGILDVLYSRVDHDVPNDLPIEKYRTRKLKSYSLQQTIHKEHSKDSIKPDPETLKSIVKDLGADLDDCVYIGDKLLKDVRMAKDAGILDVYAKYGDSRELPEYDLLKKVTHWTSDAVKDEAGTDQKDVAPTIVLENKFSEIFNYVEFENFLNSKHQNRS